MTASAATRIPLDALPTEASSPVLRTFVDLVAIPSEARDEGRVATWCRGYLEGLGLTVEEDDAATAVPGGAGTGNLFARVPGTVPGTPIFLCAHLDTVALEDTVEPIIDLGRFLPLQPVFLGGVDQSVAEAFDVVAGEHELDGREE